MFNPLTKENFDAISVIMLSDLAGVLAEKGIALTWTPGVAKYVSENSYSEKYGARNMRRFIQRSIEDPVAEKIISDHGGRISAVRLSMKGGSVGVECTYAGNA